MIIEGKAAFALHLEGKSSCYRKFIKSKNNSITERIDSKEISRKLECNGLIIATEEIPNYINEFNPLYYEADYKVKKLTKGSILAFLSTREIDINLESSIEGSEESIFSVSAHDEPYIDVEFCDDIIAVRLPKETFTEYKNWGNTEQYKKYFVMSVFVPALTYVLEKICAGEVDKELRWYTALERILDYKGINLDNESSLQVAQRLLEFPMLNAGIIGLDKDGDNE